MVSTFEQKVFNCDKFSMVFRGKLKCNIFFWNEVFKSDMLYHDSRFFSVFSFPGPVFTQHVLRSSKRTCCVLIPEAVFKPNLFVFLRKGNDEIQHVV